MSAQVSHLERPKVALVGGKVLTMVLLCDTVPYRISDSVTRTALAGWS